MFVRDILLIEQIYVTVTYHTAAMIVPGMPTLKLVKVTFLAVVQVNVWMSSVLERPVQKYFSGLRPTKLTSRAFSYLQE